MSKKPKFINANRRSFIQKSAVVGGATVTGAYVPTTAVAGETVNTDNSGADKSKPVHAGYQLTDRVKEYYRKARF